MNERRRQGQHFRGILNDLKRRPEDAARDLGVPLEEIQAIIDGERELTSKLIQRATEVWPVNGRDFFLQRDDCADGARFMRAEASAQSSRIMDRAGRPYYEYRDTAMSRVAPFRPEWIKELCVVDDNDPENELVQWNNGHFMHQFTYFVGPVNFYYRNERGEKEVAVMNTGDSMYITPFVPHTFTTRRNDAGEEGLILALTYGNKLAGDAQQELAAVGHPLSAEFALDFSGRHRAIGELLAYHRNAGSVTIEELQRRTKLTAGQVNAIENGSTNPDYSELEELAAALSINLRDLLPPDGPFPRVVNQFFANARRWKFPESAPRYELVELAGTGNLPHSKAIEINVLGHESADLDLHAGLHQYLYNVGSSDIEIHWELDEVKHVDALQPGDSVYVKPYVKHGFSGAGTLLALRIGGRMAGEPQLELSAIGRQDVPRVLGDGVQWFNPEGRRKVA